MVFVNWDKMIWYIIRICIWYVLNYYSVFVYDFCKKRIVYISLRIDFYGYYEYLNMCECFFW